MTTSPFSAEGVARTRAARIDPRNLMPMPTAANDGLMDSGLARGNGRDFFAHKKSLMPKPSWRKDGLILSGDVVFDSAYLALSVVNSQSVMTASIPS
jgi:hypothetical protein